jgi:carbamoyl-phosphate synthase large subunit
VQFGGQTPLKLAVPLERAGIRLLGTPADAIDRAEDRERFDALLAKLELVRPRAGIAKDVDEARRIAQTIGYPVLVRPSYVLGGRAMMICWSEEDLDAYVGLAIEAARDEGGSQTLLIDQFLKNAIEVDVDLISDGKRARDRRRDAAHRRSGRTRAKHLRSFRHTLGPEIVDRIESQARAGRRARRDWPDERAVRRQGRPVACSRSTRASRTVPFVSRPRAGRSRSWPPS